MFEVNITLYKKIKIFMFEINICVNANKNGMTRYIKI